MTETKTPKTNKHEQDYDSNPFTISFRGFGLLAQYAKGIVIALVVLAVLNFGFNIVGQIVSVIADSDSSSSQSDTTESSFSFDDFTNDNKPSAFSGDEEVSLESLNQTIEDNGDDVSAATIASIVALALGIVLIVFIIAGPIALLISAVTKGVIAAGMMSAADEKEISFGEAFSQMGSRLGTLFVAELISGLKILGGYLLLIVPGIRAQLRYESVPYIIMSDNEIGASDALKKSKELYDKHLMEVFGIKFVGGIIPIIGSAITAGGIGLSLRQLEAYKKNNQETPKTHWLNYLGLLLAGLFFVFIALIGIIIAIAATR